MATGMIALMTWVETGAAPDTIEALHFADDNVTVAATRPVSAYNGS
jgi:hypothetical protein